MRLVQTAIVALVVGGLLYLRLDSGALEPSPAPRLVSLPLVGLAVIFGLGAWAAGISGYRGRAPLLAGLATGVGAYAILRLVAL